MADFYQKKIIILPCNAAILKIDRRTKKMVMVVVIIIAIVLVMLFSILLFFQGTDFHIIKQRKKLIGTVFQ